MRYSLNVEVRSSMQPRPCWQHLSAQPCVHHVSQQIRLYSRVTFISQRVIIFTLLATVQAADAVGDADTKACLSTELVKRLLRTEQQQRISSLSSTLPSVICRAHTSITDQASSGSVFLARLGASLPVVGHEISEFDVNHTKAEVVGGEVSSIVAATATTGTGDVSGNISPSFGHIFFFVGAPVVAVRLKSQYNTLHCNSTAACHHKMLFGTMMLHPGLHRLSASCVIKYCLFPKKSCWRHQDQPGRDFPTFICLQSSPSALKCDQKSI